MTTPEAQRRSCCTLGEMLPSESGFVVALAPADDSREFNMIHPANAISKYAPETVIGKVKA
jgi:hypothetical protein